VRADKDVNAVLNRLTDLATGEIEKLLRLQGRALE
jgi:hypothetical protein